MSFEKMRVYLAAEQLSLRVEAMIATLPVDVFPNVRNLSRCAASTPANIAEAYGVGRPYRDVPQGRKVYHLEISRGSADETRAELRRLTRGGVLPESLSTPLMILARTVAKMLTSLIRLILAETTDSPSQSPSTSKSPADRSPVAQSRSAVP